MIKVWGFRTVPYTCTAPLDTAEKGETNSTERYSKGLRWLILASGAPCIGSWECKEEFGCGWGISETEHVKSSMVHTGEQQQQVVNDSCRQELLIIFKSEQITVQYGFGGNIYCQPLLLFVYLSIPSQQIAQSLFSYTYGRGQATLAVWLAYVL